MGWFNSIEHNRWLSGHMQALIEEVESAIVTTGFAHLDVDGKSDLTRSINLAVTGRMAYVFSLGALMGLPGARRYTDHAVGAFTNCFTSPVNGGMWFAIRLEPDADGHGVPWDEDVHVRSQYHTVYTLLGVAAVTVTDRSRVRELLNRVLGKQKELWADDFGLVWDRYDEAFNEPTPVYALGTLIHAIEACMAAAEATTEPEWLDRVEKMTAFAYKIAPKNDWRAPKYSDESWQPSPEAGKLLDDGRCYCKGYVTGHSMQFACFALQVRAGLRSMGWTVPDYLLEMRTELFERARVDSWHRTDGNPGFSIGIGDEGDPVPGEDERRQRAVCGGVCTAVAVRHAMLDDGARVPDVKHFGHCYRSFVDYIHDYLISQPGR